MTLIDAAASAVTAFFPAGGFLGVEISVGKATFISTVFGPAIWGASVMAELMDSLPQLLSQCRLQSASTQRMPHVPSATHDPQPNACRLQALVSSLSIGFATMLVKRGPAGALLGAALAQAAAVAAAGGCG